VAVRKDLPSRNTGRDTLQNRPELTLRILNSAFCIW
jgi:hypothetical protein